MIVKKMPIYKGFQTLRLLNFSPENSSKNTILHLFFTTLKPPDYQEIPRIYT